MLFKHFLSTLALTDVNAHPHSQDVGAVSGKVSFSTSRSREDIPFLNRM
jgi:hypothetical protein